MEKKTPYPTPVPPCDTKRFCAAFDSLGRNHEEKLFKLIHLLHLFGKMDDISAMVEQYNDYVYRECYEQELVGPSPERRSANACIMEHTYELPEYDFLSLLRDDNPENDVKIT